MSNIPSSISAATVQPDKSVKVTKFPAPKINQPDDVIVKVYSCAQNPTDWKSVAQGRTVPGKIVGNDIAGVVVEIGAEVTNVKVGDRVYSPPYSLTS
jgi:NADPH:quinone reductase-like Zn-dependent oxidoreductase